MIITAFLTDALMRLKFSQILPFTPESAFMSGTVVVCTYEAGGDGGDWIYRVAQLCFYSAS